MADEIKQVLGFDVADGLSNLEKFGDAISNVSGRLTRFGKALETFNGRFTGATANTDRMTEAVDRLDKRTGRLTTSMELLSRIVYTQLVIKGLRIAESAMTDAAGRAADLELKLADIATIAGKTFHGLDDIGKAVESLSRNLGTDQLAVAEGLYTAIGNQIGGTKDELIAFNRVAGEFATATLTEQQDAIKLLSGVLNSYQIDVSRSEEVASKFNKAIDIGSISGREFAAQFGRVAPQAALLGVSLDEILASFSTLTRNGLSASEAATRLLGVITGLQKPSDRLTETLERLNATSGEGLVRAAGFASALQQIAKQTDGSSAEIAKLFPNVRGLAGELILGSQKADAFASDLKAIENTATSLNRERFNLVFNTDAKKVEKELNEFRIELTKLGKELLHGTAQAFEFVGGADAITKAAKIGAPAIAALAVASATYAANTRLAVLQGTALAGVLGKLAKFGVGAGLAVSLGNLIGSELDSSRFAKLRELEAANDKVVDAFVKGEQSRLEAARKADDAIVRSNLDASREQVREFQSANALLIAEEKRLVTVATSQLNRFIHTREGFAREIERAANDSFKAIESSQQRVRDLKTELDDRKFQDNLRDASDTDKFSQLLFRAAAQARTAAKALRDAQTPDEIGHANKLFDAAEKSGETARSIAERLGDRDRENAAAATLNKLTDKRISAEKQLQSLQSQRLETAKREADRQREVTDEIKASAKALLDNLETVGLDPSERAKRSTARQDAMKRLLDASFTQSDFDLSDALGLTKLAQDMERNPLPLSFDVEDAVSRLTEGVQRNLDNFKFRVNFDVSGLETAVGRTLRTPDEIAAGLADAKTEADQLRTALSKVDQDRARALTGVKDEINALLNSTDGFANWLSRSLTVPQPDAQRALGLIDQFKTKANALVQSTDISRGQVKDLFTTVEQLARMQNSLGGSIFGSGGGLSPDIEALSTVADKLLRIANLPTVDPQQVTRLEQLESVINSSRTASAAIEESLTNGANRLEAALVNGAARLEAAVTRLSATRPGNFASGGLARGTDTVPAMLTRGEMVINPRSSQRFFSDLQRINAGMTPTYRQGGGDVTTVGDVSINVSGAGRPEQTAEVIARKLRRGFRKGTIRKF